jgi:hypothetical protein
MLHVLMLHTAWTSRNAGNARCMHPLGIPLAQPDWSRCSQVMLGRRNKRPCPLYPINIPLWHVKIVQFHHSSVYLFHHSWFLWAHSTFVATFFSKKNSAVNRGNLISLLGVLTNCYHVNLILAHMDIWMCCKLVNIQICCEFVSI